eukprot:4413314-Pyramimonas_sp.AAC.2
MSRAVSPLTKVCRGARLVGLDTDTVKLPVKTLFSRLVARKFDSPTHSLRTPCGFTDAIRICVRAKPHRGARPRLRVRTRTTRGAAADADADNNIARATLCPRKDRARDHTGRATRADVRGCI